MRRYIYNCLNLNEQAEKGDFILFFFFNCFTTFMVSLTTYYRLYTKHSIIDDTLTYFFPNE